MPAVICTESKANESRLFVRMLYLELCTLYHSFRCIFSSLICCRKLVLRRRLRAQGGRGPVDRWEVSSEGSSSEEDIIAELDDAQKRSNREPCMSTASCGSNLHPNLALALEQEILSDITAVRFPHFG